MKRDGLTMVITDFDDPDLIPTSGVVEFAVWPLEQDIRIDGPTRWRRVAVFLLNGEPVVRAEAGEHMPASAYLENVLPPNLKGNHGHYRHLMDETGPIDDAPTIIALT